MKDLLKITKLSKSTRPLALLSMFYIAIAILSVALGYGIGLISELVIQSKYSVALNLVLIYSLVALLLVSLTFYSGRYATKFSKTLVSRLKTYTLNGLMHSDYKERSAFEQGDLLGRFNIDVSSMASALTLLSSFLKSFLIISVYILGFSFIDVRLLGLFLLPFPIVIAIQLWVSSHTESYIMPWKIAMGNTYNLAQDLLSNAIPLRSLGIQNKALIWTDSVLNDSFKAAMKGISKIYMFQIPSVVISLSPILLIGGLGTLWIYQGTLSFASLFTALSLTQTANEEINNMLNCLNNIPHLLGSARRIFPLWDLPKEIEGTRSQGLEEDILFEFKNVSFRYDDARDDVLKNITFKLKVNQKLGIIGHSGSGKSTLLKLMSGLYTPTSGDIFYKGIPLKEWNLDHLRNKLAIVSQNALLFDSTIKNNISITNPDSSESTMRSMLDALDFKTFDGQDVLDIACGEKGNLLSGGQRQRIAIARALLKKSDLLIFDEGTSALDNNTETLIQELLANPDYPSQILIAHRLNTLKDCDVVIHLEKGNIVNQGEPETVLQSFETLSQVRDTRSSL